MGYVEAIERAKVNTTAMDAVAKGYRLIELCNVGVCSISGGSDSDIMLDIVHTLDSDNKIKYVFFDTGIEYKATKDHLDYLEQKYDITIDKVKAIKPIPTSCREYGVPFLSKHVSEMIYRLQRHGFKWEDKPYEELLAEYPKCKSALQWWCNKKVRRDGKIGSLNIGRDKYLKEFMVANPPTFRISQKCCTYAKKRVAEKYKKDVGCDLSIVGVRKSEGGIRSTQYKTCFSNSSNGDEWRPLFWFSNKDKQEYKEFNNIHYSDCYEVYCMSRTGCVGCPFNSKFEEELDRLQKYEPLLYKAVIKIFGESYEYTRAYRKYKAEREYKEAS